MEIMVLLILLVIAVILLCLRIFFMQRLIHKKNLVEVYSQECIVAISEKLTFLYVSPSSVNTLELPSSLLQGREIREFVHPDDIDVLVRSLQGIMNNDSRTIGKENLNKVLFRCRHGSEGWCWVEMYGKKNYWDSNIKALICYLKNVDTVMKLRSDLASLEKRMQIFLKLSYDIVWAIDVEKRELELLTPIVFERHKVPSRVPGVIPKQELMPIEDLHLIENVINARVQHFSEFEQDVPNPEEIFIRLYGVDESRVWYSLRGLFDRLPDGRLMFYGTGHLMDRSLVNKTSPEIKSYLFDIIVSLPYVRVFRVDQDLVYVGCNQTFASDLGQYNTGKIIGESMDTFSMNATLKMVLKDNILRAFKSKRSCSGKAEFFMGSDDIPHVCFYSLIPLEDELKNVQAVMGIYQIINVDRLVPLELNM